MQRVTIYTRHNAMATIDFVTAYQILDSRGVPTVEVLLQLDTGHQFTSSAPGGTSTGKYEALELRDNNDARFFGMEVSKAVAVVKDVIAPRLKGLDPTNQAGIDQIIEELDGTKNKSKLGANATLPVSQAVCKAGAVAYNLHLFDYISKAFGFERSGFPIPTFNVINGGKHGAGNLDFQEFHVIPLSTRPYPETVRMAAEVYHALEMALMQMNAIHSVGIEGGFAPNLFTNKDALEIIIESIRRTEYVFSKDIFLGLDVAAAHFFHDGRYHIKDRPKPITADELYDFYKELTDTIHLFSIEDAFAEDDWKAWAHLTANLGSSSMIVGDDFLASNRDRVAKAIQEKACTAILVKPNQIGTLTETFEVIKMAQAANWYVIASHRSGETNDTFVSDFAVGIGANYTKFGAPARGERVAKYNRLLEIYRILNPDYQL